MTWCLHSKARDGPRPEDCHPEHTHRAVLCLLHPDPQDFPCQQLQRRPSTLWGEDGEQLRWAEASAGAAQAGALHPDPSDLHRKCLRLVTPCQPTVEVPESPRLWPPASGLPLISGAPLLASSETRGGTTRPRSHARLKVAFRTPLLLRSLSVKLKETQPLQPVSQLPGTRATITSQQNRVITQGDHAYVPSPGS